MNYKKIFILFSLLLLMMIPNYGEEIELAKFYIKKAFTAYNNNNFNLAKQNIREAREYSSKIPEYYYIDNLLLSNEKSQISLKQRNAEQILNNINNSFIIDKYQLLKQAYLIYKKIRNFDKCVEIFNKMDLITNNYIVEDYMDYIKMLFNADKNYLKLIPEVIKKGQTLSDIQDFNYFNILYNIKMQLLSLDKIKTSLTVLENNGYSKSRILYLKALYYNDKNMLNTVYSDYLKLNELNQIEAGFRKKIVYNILLKPQFFTLLQLNQLLIEWNLIGQNDLITINLFNNKIIREILQKNSQFNDQYLRFSGIRRLDQDDDGDWEQYCIYKNGIKIEEITDENQDGLYTTRAVFFDNGYIKEYYIYLNTNDNYNKFIFNENDHSLLFIENYQYNKISKRKNLIKSVYFPKINELKNLDIKKINPYIVSDENYDSSGYSFNDYYNSIPIYTYVDKNQNKINEKKIYYTNGIISQIQYDLDEDGENEIIEYYDKGNLSSIISKTNKNLEFYDYKEVYYKDRIEKLWDNNGDKIYEYLVEEFKSGLTYRKYDINDDGFYDYIYQVTNNNNLKIYKANKNNQNDLNLVHEYSSNKSSVQQKWLIVSANDINNLIIPDDIVIQDSKSLTGYYLYNKLRIRFNMGKIDNDNFSYRLSIINNKIYLFDNN